MSGFHKVGAGLPCTTLSSDLLEVIDPIDRINAASAQEVIDRIALEWPKAESGECRLYLALVCFTASVRGNVAWNVTLGILESTANLGALTGQPFLDADTDLMKAVAAHKCGLLEYSSDLLNQVETGPYGKMLLRRVDGIRRGFGLT